MGKNKPEKVLCRYEFSKDELMELSEKIAHTFNQKERVEDEKKDAMAAFKEQIQLLDTQCKRLSQNIANGYEMRLIDCEVIFNRELSEVQKKRLDTGEIVSARPMNEDEKQMKIEEIEVGD